MHFAPGEVLIRRCWQGGRLRQLQVARVAADDERGLRLWLPAGSPWWRAQADGRLAPTVSTGSDVLLWMPTGRSFSVQWFWRDGGFDGWTAHIEEPYVRWADRGCAGVDTTDAALDLVVTADHSWQWRDEHGQAAQAWRPALLDTGALAQAAVARTTGDRLVKLAEAGEFPFDGTWCGFRPDASWTVPGLPPGADRPRALAEAATARA